MPWKNSDTRYSTMSIALHWLMVVLLAVAKDGQRWKVEFDVRGSAAA